MTVTEFRERKHRHTARFRPVVICLALLVATEAIAIAGCGGAVASARPTTTVTVFRAFAASGSATIKVSHVRGSCYRGALNTRRSDAWGCVTAGPDLWDPCFSSTHAPGVVVCPNDNPASGIEIKLGQGLPGIKLVQGLPTAYRNRGAPSARYSWSIELSNGEYCGMVFTATQVVHGVHLDYTCAGDNRIGLWGLPRRTTEPWTILIAPRTATTLTKRIAIKRAWT